MTRFIVDAQMPPALARWLSSQGHDALHVDDIGLAAASDADIWARALRDGAVIVTKDEDFAYRRACVDQGPSIVWIRLRNTRKIALLAWFEGALPAIEAAISRGETLVEIV